MWLDKWSFAEAVISHVQEAAAIFTYVYWHCYCVQSCQSLRSKVRPISAVNRVNVTGSLKIELNQNDLDIQYITRWKNTISLVWHSTMACRFAAWQPVVYTGWHIESWKTVNLLHCNIKQCMSTKLYAIYAKINKTKKETNALKNMKIIFYESCASSHKIFHVGQCTSGSVWHHGNHNNGCTHP